MLPQGQTRQAPQKPGTREFLHPIKDTCEVLASLALPQGHPQGQEPGRLSSGWFYSQVPGRMTRKRQDRHPDWKGTREVPCAGDVVLRTTHPPNPDSTELIMVSMQNITCFTGN